MKSHFKTLSIINYAVLIFLSSCSVSKQISKQAHTILLKDSAIASGHIGISIYEPATNTYWYDHDASKYFIPASNTKLFTLYAGMKYLGDSLVGLRYNIINDTLFCLPTGDPTLMHPDFANQPVYTFLNKTHLPTLFIDEDLEIKKYGYGWAWDDYNSDYMAERNAFPIYGNLMKVGFQKNNVVNQHDIKDSFSYYKLEILSPQLSTTGIKYHLKNTLKGTVIKRMQESNNLDVFFPGKEISLQTEIPFATDGINTALQILHQRYPWVIPTSSTFNIQHSTFKILHSQPSDSLFKPMMHRSDNFFAEQTLLMASNEHLGYMNDEKIIDTILKTDLKDIPQKPKWVDGSGLSRYNLFTPKDFVYILNKMKNDFGLERMKVILATGGEGTLAAYYKKSAGFIYAKTGTLSNNCALSGYLITNKGKLLIFSVLANNYISSATPVRRAVERFLNGIREKY
jgi:D-alanyl-D-alanine carboxypeptidase/D-alanyl-D-alanine-endopeptidase (penicillin-binding protein 4)